MTTCEYLSRCEICEYDDKQDCCKYQNYKSSERLLARLQRERLKSKSWMGKELMAKKSKSNVDGSDICKRLRKNIARINTILAKRK